MPQYASSLFGSGSGPVISQQKTYPVTATFPQQAGVMEALSVLSGAMTSGVSKNILTVTGRGRLLFAGLSATNATARTLTPNIRIDGTSILSPAVNFTAANTGCSLVGAARYTGDSGVSLFQPIDFQGSLAIDLTSNLSETDGATIYYRYEVWQ